MIEKPENRGGDGQGAGGCRPAAEAGRCAGGEGEGLRLVARGQYVANGHRWFDLMGLSNVKGA
jgi:hypothetical protein